MIWLSLSPPNTAWVVMTRVSKFDIITVLLLCVLVSMQRYLHVILVLVAIVCIPWMLCIKPFYLLYKHKRETKRMVCGCNNHLCMCTCMSASHCCTDANAVCTWVKGTPVFTQDTVDLYIMKLSTVHFHFTLCYAKGWGQLRMHISAGQENSKQSYLCFSKPNSKKLDPP